MRPVAERHAVRDEIVLEPRHAAEEGMRADAGELDDGGAAADESTDQVERRPGSRAIHDGVQA